MDQKGVKAITHASLFFAPILVPLVVWLLIQDRHVKNIALQALLFHVIMSILFSISLFLSFFVIGIPFVLVFGFMILYYPIKGIVYALQDRPFRYPVIGSLIG
ncbi:DUF4870 domain-containing protein [Brevibacillus sp. NL20B1]|jgi:hypothetical protein|uniref:DUF4870 domain-containing protein n=1 Tax=Brevibacillus sp. NL20B1 TaxID=2829799 RepID=UPI001B9D667F|nr:DUF4870 domain-containing protein [Brevibacillus sp. NL20B1]MBR8659923.1 DUF4870 domain-containing protein [Brevibacillus sp. NL20B1]